MLIKNKRVSLRPDAGGMIPPAWSPGHSPAALCIPRKQNLWWERADLQAVPESVSDGYSENTPLSCKVFPRETALTRSAEICKGKFSKISVFLFRH
jgi:hypothetical protein